MKELKINRILCDRKCLQVCHSQIDRLLFRMDDGDSFLLAEPVLSQIDIKIKNAVEQCPKKALYLEKFTGPLPLFS